MALPLWGNLLLAFPRREGNAHPPRNLTAAPDATRLRHVAVSRAFFRSAAAFEMR